MRTAAPVSRSRLASWAIAGKPSLLQWIRTPVVVEHLVREIPLERMADRVHVQTRFRLAPCDPPVVNEDQGAAFLPDLQRGICRLLEQESPGVHLQVLQDILRDLLEARSIDKEIGQRAVRFLFQPQELDPTIICLMGDRGFQRTPEGKGNAIRLPVVDRIEHPLSRSVFAPCSC